MEGTEELKHRTGGINYNFTFQYKHSKLFVQQHIQQQSSVPRQLVYRKLHSTITCSGTYSVDWCKGVDTEATFTRAKVDRI